MKRHWHVHSHIGGGYLCECDSHYPYDARGRDQALREERDGWRDYADDSNGRSIRISGSIRSGSFIIDDTESIAWVRYVDAWECSEASCYEEEE
jgi:hypothetical protein